MSGSMKSTTPGPSMYRVPPLCGCPEDVAPPLEPPPPTDPEEHAATPASMTAAPTIAKVREAWNERLIRSPFQNWHLLDATSDMDIQTTASPAAAIAQALHIRTDRPCYTSSSRSQQQRTAHHIYVRMLSIRSYRSYDRK